MKSRHGIWWSILLSMGLLAAVASPVTAAPKGRVVAALGSDTSTMDPHMHTERVGIIINQHIFDTLLARDTKTWRPIPHLAETITSVNPTTWELKLRRGVKFHNGEPFTAESVKFTFERVLNPDQKSPIRGNFTWIKSVDVVDDHTVRLVTQKPYPLIQEILTFGNFGMVPPKYIREKGDAHFARNPVGTGPFKFIEWRKGEQTTLEANDQYWKGAPAIKTLVFRVIPETATQIAELLSGGVDFIRAVPPDQIPAIKASGQARVTATKILRVAYLQMDGDARAAKTPLTDVRVRRAVNHAVNVDEIMQKILGGMAVRTPAGNNPMAFGFDPAIKPYALDPERAKKLLAEAGFPNGFDIALNTYAGSIVNVDQVAQAVQGYLGKAGIRVKPRHFADVGQYLSNFRGSKLDGITFASWGYNSVFDSDALYYIHFHKGEPYTYNSSPEMDQWLEDARATVDPRKRQELYSRLQRFIVDQAYWVPMYAQYTIEAVTNRLSYEASSDEIMRIHSATWKQ
ncbi:MAG: ABC transporter substrate-binding protein [Candidatus Rokubacteria bacterium]|nr:ABC transporter substrate-binding protein [Candidatus Rokubacteria bacterium]